jgi:retron-type reverse transcriptase
MTPGLITTTLDDMDSKVIYEIIESLKNKTFQFAPSRRIQIPKSNEGHRPLTI